MAPKQKFNGWVVEADEPTRMPSPKEGVEFFITETVRTLLLENGEIVYKCGEKDCGWWSEKPRAVLSHRRVHKPKKAEVELAKKAGVIATPEPDESELPLEMAGKTVGDYSLNDLFDIISGYFDTVGDRPIRKTVESDELETWKTRALHAEAKLSDFKKMIADS